MNTKKLLLITLLNIGLLSCTTHVNYPLKVTSIKLNEIASHISKYELTVSGNCLCSGDLKIYTDSLFQIGDTIK